MKIKIRKNVFETNSSSMHSICIMKEEAPSLTDKINNLWCSYGELSYYNECDFEFGRYPFKVLITANDKIPYIFASLCPGCRLDTDPVFKKTYKSVIKAIQTKYPECKSIKFPWYFEEYGFNKLLVDSNRHVYSKYDDRVVYEWEKGIKKPYSDYVLKETGERLKISKSKKQTYYCGFVDHQSSDLLCKLLSKEISLEEFIFNPKYIVIIDGDEYNNFDIMKKAGLIKEENIKNEISVY